MICESLLWLVICMVIILYKRVWPSAIMVRGLVHPTEGLLVQSPAILLSGNPGQVVHTCLTASSKFGTGWGVVCPATAQVTIGQASHWPIHLGSSWGMAQPLQLSCVCRSEGRSRSRRDRSRSRHWILRQTAYPSHDRLQLAVDSVKVHGVN